MRVVGSDEQFVALQLSEEDRMVVADLQEFGEAQIVFVEDDEEPVVHSEEDLGFGRSDGDDGRLDLLDMIGFVCVFEELLREPFRIVDRAFNNG